MGKTHGLAVTSLVLGIIGLVLCWVPLLGQLLLIGAIICGVIGLHKIKTDNTLEGKGMAIAGIVMGGIGLLISVFAFIGMMAYFGVLSPNNMLPEKTQFKAPISAYESELNTQTNSLEVAFQNSLGGPITLPMTTSVASEQCLNPTLTGQYAGQAITPSTQIPNGGAFTLKWTCNPSGKNPRAGDDFRADISFGYVSVDSGMMRTHVGSVMSTYK